MTDDLRTLLRDRADRALTPDDPREVVDGAAVRALRRRRDRTRLAVASTVAVVVAVTCLGLVAGADRSPHGNQVGGSTHTGRQHRLEHQAEKRGQVEKRHQAEAARKYRVYRQHLAMLARHKLERRLAKAVDDLVPIAPAPAANEISTALVPNGFVYLGNQTPAVSLYGFPGTDEEGAYSNGLVFEVHLTMAHTAFPDTIAGRPASFHTTGTSSVLDLKYSDKYDIGFQAGFAMTRSQAARIAAGLDVRATTHVTEG